MNCHEALEEIVEICNRAQLEASLSANLQGAVYRAAQTYAEAIATIKCSALEAIGDELEEAEQQRDAGLCPVCGQVITIIGNTKDGRLIGSCKDAFTQEQWEAKDE